MNILFHQMRTGKKGQIATILTVALVIFVIAAFIVVNLGKSKIQQGKVMDAAKAGVLAGGSSACILLNNMANLNDNMVTNFAGFTVAMEFLLVSYAIDYVKLVPESFLTIPPPVGRPSGCFPDPNFAAELAAAHKRLVDIALGVLNICVTVTSIILLLNGATASGNALYKIIGELNDDLPKDSRNSARQYAFSNVGVDEPKISFAQAVARGLCNDAWGYSLLETKFDTFMRELPVTNKNDLNYGTSTLTFDWDDHRTGHTINNNIAVIVSPVPIASTLRKVTYGEVAGSPGTFLGYWGSHSSELNPIIGTLVTLAIALAPVMIALIWATVALIIALAAIYWYILAALTVLATGFIAAGIAFSAACDAFTVCCGIPWTAAACCPQICVWCPWIPYFTLNGTYYGSAAVLFTIFASGATAASAAFTKAMSDTPPQNVPCFAAEQLPPGARGIIPAHSISVTVTRTTNPLSTDYVIYKTDWPVKSDTESGVVSGGSIFPPSQEYDIYPNF